MRDAIPETATPVPEAGVVPRERLAGARVLVVGDVMLDRYWFGDVNRISPEAPVPVVLVKRTDERPGGAANVARNITALDGAATLLAVVGNDEAATSLERLLREERGLSLERRDVARDVRRAARAFLASLHVHHRHRRLGRDAAHVAEPVAVEHHVARDQHARAREVGQRLHLRCSLPIG